RTWARKACGGQFTRKGGLRIGGVRKDPLKFARLALIDAPRLRLDLRSSPVEVDGFACVDVTDPRSGTSFRFYDFEFAIATHFDGAALTDVARWAAQTFGFDATAEGLAEFAGKLRELGFLQPSAREEGERDFINAPQSTA